MDAHRTHTTRGMGVWVLLGAVAALLSLADPAAAAGAGGTVQKAVIGDTTVAVGDFVELTTTIEAPGLRRGSPSMRFRIEIVSLTRSDVKTKTTQYEVDKGKTKVLRTSTQTLTHDKLQANLKRLVGRQDGDTSKKLTPELLVVAERPMACEVVDIDRKNSKQKQRIWLTSVLFLGVARMEMRTGTSHVLIRVTDFRAAGYDAADERRRARAMGVRPGPSSLAKPASTSGTPSRTTPRAPRPTPRPAPSRTTPRSTGPISQQYESTRAAKDMRTCTRLTREATQLLSTVTDAASARKVRDGLAKLVAEYLEANCYLATMSAPNYSLSRYLSVTVRPSWVQARGEYRRQVVRIQDMSPEAGKILEDLLVF